MSVWVIMGHDDTPGKTKEANDIMGHKIIYMTREQ